MKNKCILHIKIETSYLISMYISIISRVMPFPHPFVQAGWTRWSQELNKAIE
jgi:hypothetical protein